MATADKAKAGPLQISAQVVFYGLLALLIGYFSASPVYTYMAPDKALIRISFSHAAQPVRECRRLTPEEIAQLAPNMRQPMDCPRERLPLLVELELDGRLLYRGSHAPSGLWGDGPATVYRRFVVEPGRHRLVARLRESKRSEGFDYEHSENIDLRPQQNFVVDFKPNTGGFNFL